MHSKNKILRVLEGVNELLETLQRAGIPMGLVTGNMEAIAWLKLEKVGLNRYFQFRWFWRQGHKKKWAGSKCN